MTLTERAIEVITTASPAEKVRLTRLYTAAWAAGEISEVGNTAPPDRPARPDRPELCAPGAMPKRSKAGEKGRIALLHALAHIELNAIDLAWDIVARFTHEDLPKAFYDDWVQVALDEAEHFDMLEKRLNEMGAAYGDQGAHDGLWQAATETADDLMARLAVVPMVLEARGLDTTPPTVKRLRANQDNATADLLDIIATEEVPHVAAGVRWFEYLASKRGIEPIAEFHALIAARFRGKLKPPFNDAARAKAGMVTKYYMSSVS